MALLEGALVAVLARGSNGTFTLAQQEEDQLLEALSEIEQGDFVELEDLLGSLPR